MIPYIVLIVILILFSAIFSAAETAFSSASRNRLKAMAEKGSLLAGAAGRMLENYDRLLTTILIGNNIVNIAAAAAATVVCVRLWPASGAAISTIVLTLAILVFGEITPKSLAHEFPERVVLLTTPFLWLPYQLCRPMNAIFSAWRNFISKRFRKHDDQRRSQEELLMLVEEVQNEGCIDKDEGVLLRNAIKFTECRVEDIVTHRVDIAAIPVTATRDEVAAKFAETEYSRMPVYRENLDNIVGIVLLRDFFSSQRKGGAWRLKDIITPPFFIQKTEKIDDVLKKLQDSKSQIAIVLDEFGGTLGILSMEDILEELVGEIWDEHDEVVEKFRAVDENTYSVDCSASLDEFREFFAKELPSEEAFLSGWILEQLQKVPQKGDAFTVDGLRIVVSACSRHRVRRIDVTRLPPADT